MCIFCFPFLHLFFKSKQLNCCVGSCDVIDLTIIHAIFICIVCLCIYRANNTTYCNMRRVDVLMILIVLSDISYILPNDEQNDAVIVNLFVWVASPGDTP